MNEERERERERERGGRERETDRQMKRTIVGGAGSFAFCGSFDDRNTGQFTDPISIVTSYDVWKVVIAFTSFRTHCRIERDHIVCNTVVPRLNGNAYKGDPHIPTKTLWSRIFSGFSNDKKPQNNDLLYKLLVDIKVNFVGPVRDSL